MDVLPDEAAAATAEITAGCHSMPDQPNAHRVKDDSNDPLKGISVPVEGDQLTRVRLAGARDLVAGNKTATQRFDHTVPYRSALWHTKASFLQYCYTLLYDSKSVKEVGTLKFYRERYRRVNVTPEHVNKSYEGCEQFLISVGKAYVIAAALEFWGMRDVTDTPRNHQPPKGIARKSPATKQKSVESLGTISSQIAAILNIFLLYFQLFPVYVLPLVPEPTKRKNNKKLK